MTFRRNNGVTGRRFPLVLLLVAAAGCLLLHTGCSTPTITNTSRNIVEQLLISSAVERCMYQIDFSMYRDAKVFARHAHPPARSFEHDLARGIRKDAAHVFERGAAPAQKNRLRARKRNFAAVGAG